MGNKYGPSKVNKYQVFLCRQKITNISTPSDHDIPAAQLLCVSNLPPEKQIAPTIAELQINFWSGGADQLRQNQTNTKDNIVTGTLHLPADQFVWYLDLLRNEEPLLFINEGNPMGNLLFSDPEKAGWGHAEEI